VLKKERRIEEAMELSGLHKVNVKGKLRDIKLLDPFASFGSTSLGAAKLGVDEIFAAKFLPVTYIILKAILGHLKNYEELAAYEGMILEHPKCRGLFSCHHGKSPQSSKVSEFVMGLGPEEVVCCVPAC